MLNKIIYLFFLTVLKGGDSFVRSIHTKNMTLVPYIFMKDVYVIAQEVIMEDQ